MTWDSIEGVVRVDSGLRVKSLIKTKGADSDSNESESNIVEYCTSKQIEPSLTVNQARTFKECKGRTLTFKVT